MKWVGRIKPADTRDVPGRCSVPKVRWVCPGRSGPVTHLSLVLSESCCGNKGRRSRQAQLISRRQTRPGSEVTFLQVVTALGLNWSSGAFMVKGSHSGCPGSRPQGRCVPHSESDILLQPKPTGGLARRLLPPLLVWAANLETAQGQGPPSPYPGKVVFYSL